MGSPDLGYPAKESCGGAETERTPKRRVSAGGRESRTRALLHVIHKTNFVTENDNEETVGSFLSINLSFPPTATLSLSLSDKHRALEKPRLTSSTENHSFPVSLCPVLAVVEAAFPRRFALANGFSSRGYRSEFGSVSRARSLRGKQWKLTMGVPLGSVSRAVVCVVLVVICSAVFECDAQRLPQDEVDTLNTIATKMQNEYWSVNETSCNGGIGLNVTLASGIMSNVTCNCSFNDSTVCHVTNIQLKGLNLTGIFPDEFGNLTYLTEIDLSRNYINGTIPTTLTQIPLTILSALGNRISSIPKEIGNISTLEALVLEDNLLEGALEPSIGNLSRLTRLLLSANNFTGSIPESFGNLKNLDDFRIDGSTLSGKIPDFIGNWTKITRLDMQGTSMEGPIPSSISLLTNLTSLRISDLKGPSSDFPNLQGMSMMQTLILRNCLLTGSIPDYIGKMTGLKTLDLGDNILTGHVPDTMGEGLNYMFLTNNSLTGTVPSWVTSSKQSLDLSYNNFTGSPPISCQQSQVNLVFSYSSNGNNSLWCLEKDLPCSGKAQYHSLFINCGGSKMTFEGNQYEEDTSPNGPSVFSSSSSEKWAYSSTGVYIGNDDAPYTVNNPFSMNVIGSEFYQTARLSPWSIRYYGLCMMKGSYKVRLHFAEIQYSNDETFSSLGRRIFDVSIQGHQVLKDFNIAEEAGGVGKGIYKDFNNVTVNGSTLEIHLYWSGKGTTAIPDRGVYGPLISAIAVTPNFDVGSAGLSAGAITGIVVASVVLLILILLVLRLTGFLGGREVEDPGEAYVLQEQGNVLELVDPRLGSDYSEEEAMRMLNLALLCTNPSPTLRPPMSSVVSMLEGKSAIQAPIIKRTTTNPNPRFKAFERLANDSQTNVSTFSQDTRQLPGSMSIEGPWIDSSASFTSKDDTRSHSSESKLRPDF
ncbi:hypothetical protein NL676_023993 [Syzygium grande]|nr:hypothetical protein NL676_023993 [Syzygium grande]